MATFRAVVLFAAALLAFGPRGDLWGETPSKSLTSSASANSAHHSGAKLRAALRSALKNAAAAKDRDQEQAARALVALYRELGEDSSLTATERASLGAAARDRLTRISKQIQNRLAREKDHAGRSKRTGAAQPPRPEALLSEELPPLAAQQFPAAAQQFPLPAQPFAAPAPRAPNQFQQPLFGPPVPAPIADRGQELVELIEQTIAPGTWASQGGQGSIYYFRPSHALIVNQNAAVHDQLGGLIQQLRK